MRTYHLARQTCDPSSLVPEDKRRRTTSTDSSSGGSSISSSTTNGREAIKIDMYVSQLRDLYLDVLERRMPHHIESEIYASIHASENKGQQILYYEYALREASYAPRPSWAYVRAIVKRLQLEGATLDGLPF